MAKKISNEIKTEQVPLSELKFAGYNPRSMTEEAFNGLVESIREFGMPQPIVANRANDKTIIGGHQRYRAAQVLKWKTVPVIWLDLDTAREKALNATLNNKKIQGSFTDQIDEIIRDIKVELGEDFLKALALDKLEMPSWDPDLTDLKSPVDEIEANLDGIQVTIKVRCPQDIKDEVLIFLKAKFLETSFEGVHIE